MKAEDIARAVKSAREKSSKRKFKQSFDLVVNLRDFDIEKAENKINEEVLLPSGRGKPVKVAAIAEGAFLENVKKAGIEDILNKADLAKFSKDKKGFKKIVNNTDFFISQPDLMVEVGKTLGPVLGPRAKMPKPLPPNIDLKPFLERLNNLAILRIRNQPVIQCLVGSEDFDDAQVIANIEAVLNALARKLPKGESQIRSAHLKLTMGPAVKLGAVKEAAKKGEEKK